jgi:hypothetical protein
MWLENPTANAVAQGAALGGALGASIGARDRADKQRLICDHRC